MAQYASNNDSSALFVLIHSPLVGPLTWALVADALRQRGRSVIVPSLREQETPEQPYWQQHAEAVVRALAQLPHDRACILVAHSGAGILLPAISQLMAQRVAAYIFVDAGIPVDGLSRLELFDSFDGATQFRQAAVDGMLPTWSDADLADTIPDAQVRQRFVAELRPLPLAVYEEPIPVFRGWPDAPCGYLQFGANPAYAGDIARARAAAWAMADLAGNHFHMLIDPAAVAQALVDLADGMGSGDGL